MMERPFYYRCLEVLLLNEMSYRRKCDTLVFACCLPFFFFIYNARAGSSSGTSQPEWAAIIKAVGNYKGRRFLGAVLRGCDGYRLEEGSLYLSFRFQSNLERLKEELDWPESRRKFIEAVTKVTGISAEPSIEFVPVDPSQSNRKATRSPLVQAALGMGGRIIQESDNDDE